MPVPVDNSALIAQIRALLNNGVQGSSIDGTSRTLDFETLRRQLRQLMREDIVQQMRRPRISTVNLSALTRPAGGTWRGYDQ